MHAEHERVLRFMAEPKEDLFSELAVAVFRHQCEYIPALQSWCERRGVRVESLDHWRAIPPVPVTAFKYQQLWCAPPERVFLSSGTTRGAEMRSQHGVPDLRLYRQSALLGLRTFVFPDVQKMPILSLIPAATEWPQSSLAQMVTWAQEAFGDSGSATFAHAGELDFRGLQSALEESARTGVPVCIMTTTGACIRFLDWCQAERWSVRLPHGSRLMDTGGQKGAPRPLSRNGLVHAVWNTLAIPGYYVVNEYGMSELSSQYYDTVIADRVSGRLSPRSKKSMPWLRTRVLDPQTLSDLPPGEVGLLCHVDLANAGSVVAVLTEDLGRLTDAGLELLGRAQEAELRGCSLALAEFVAR